MPRPKNGYVNATGQPVPGTHDPINRYMDKTALMHWAYNPGKDGMPLYDRAAIDIGSTVHHMAELISRDGLTVKSRNMPTTASWLRIIYGKPGLHLANFASGGSNAMSVQLPRKFRWSRRATNTAALRTPLR